MSNLTTAIKAIKSELARAEQGLLFYRNHVDSLKAALAGLDKVEGKVVQALKSQAARKHPATSLTKQAETQRKIRQGKTPRRAERPKGELPKTGMEFWLQYIVEAPRTAVEITRAAINGLGFIPTSEQTKVLKQRLGPTLESMVKSGRIQDSGAGRERRFVSVSTKARLPRKPAVENSVASQV